MADPSPANANREMNLAGATETETSVHKVLGTATLRRTQIPVRSVAYLCSRSRDGRAEGPKDLLIAWLPVGAMSPPYPRIATLSQQPTGLARATAGGNRLSHDEPTTPALSRNA
jgi:hypothetical protein